MRTILLIPLIGLFPGATGTTGQERILLPALAETVRGLIGQMEKGTTTADILRARDALVGLGQVVVPQVARQYAKGSPQVKWGLLQVLALTGGREAVTNLGKVLTDPRCRNRPGCLSFAALGLREESYCEVLLDLAKRGGEKEAWGRISAFLALAGPAGRKLAPGDLPARPGGESPLELAAFLLLISRRGTDGRARELLADLGERPARDWGGRLVRRCLALMVARRRITGSEDRLLAWLAAESAREEDRAAVALALGALGIAGGPAKLADRLGSPVSWAGYLGLASTTPLRTRVVDLARSRVLQKGSDPALGGVFAGAFARCLDREDLLIRSSAYEPGNPMREVLVLELAQRVLTAPSREWLERVAARSRSWEAKGGVADLLLASLAVREVAPGQGVLPPGWGIKEKAYRGEISAGLLGREVDRGLRRLGAHPDQPLRKAEEMQAYRILMGPSGFLARVAREQAAPRDELELPGGAPPRDSRFFEHLHDFLGRIPLFVDGEREE